MIYIKKVNMQLEILKNFKGIDVTNLSECFYRYIFDKLFQHRTNSFLCSFVFQYYTVGVLLNVYTH
jgi:hypothetical protein